MSAPNGRAGQTRHSPNSTHGKPARPLTGPELERRVREFAAEVGGMGTLRALCTAIPELDTWHGERHAALEDPDLHPADTFREHVDMVLDIYLDDCSEARDELVEDWDFVRTTAARLLPHMTKPRPKGE